jgi:spore maturation protein CgeB
MYLPFAYDPTLHYPDPPTDDKERTEYACDVLFVGTGDRDRVPIIAALDRNGFRVGLYGSYWERYAATRHLTRGQADARTLRKATSDAHVALCLVRRANRDGHVMRSFEIPATGACMLTEDTAEHRAFFGAEGDATVYFSSITEMLDKLRWLMDNPLERERLARTIRTRITGGDHTYGHRLTTILDSVNLKPWTDFTSERTK